MNRRKTLEYINRNRKTYNNGNDAGNGIRLLKNTASGRVLEKCGFETFFTGEGDYHDGVYEISKSVWKI